MASVLAVDAGDAIAWQELTAALARVRQRLDEAERELRLVRARHAMLTAPSARVALRLPAGGRLTNSEARVALLASCGMTDAQIATLLHVSGHTVKSHMKSVLRKLGLRSRWQLASASQCAAGQGACVRA